MLRGYDPRGSHRVRPDVGGIVPLRLRSRRQPSEPPPRRVFAHAILAVCRVGPQRRGGRPAQRPAVAGVRTIRHVAAARRDLGNHTATAAERPVRDPATSHFAPCPGHVGQLGLPAGSRQSAGDRGGRLLRPRVRPPSGRSTHTPSAGTASPGSIRATRATYRYDPLQDAATAGGGTITFTPDENRLGPPPAWAWSCHLESRYEVDGTGQHLAAYRVQNAGKDQLQIDLPPPLTQENVRGIWIDEARVPWHGVSGPSDSRLSIASRRCGSLPWSRSVSRPMVHPSGHSRRSVRSCLRSTSPCWRGRGPCGSRQAIRPSITP